MSKLSLALAAALVASVASAQPLPRPNPKGNLSDFLPTLPTPPAQLYKWAPLDKTPLYGTPPKADRLIPKVAPSGPLREPVSVAPIECPPVYLSRDGKRLERLLITPPEGSTYKIPLNFAHEGKLWFKSTCS